MDHSELDVARVRLQLQGECQPTLMRAGGEGGEGEGAQIHPNRLIWAPSRPPAPGNPSNLGVPSISILSRDPNLFRKPSKTQGKQPVFEKNDG